MGGVLASRKVARTPPTRIRRTGSLYYLTKLMIKILNSCVRVILGLLLGFILNS